MKNCEVQAVRDKRALGAWVELQDDNGFKTYVYPFTSFDYGTEVRMAYAWEGIDDGYVHARCIVAG